MRATTDTRSKVYRTKIDDVTIYSERCGRGDPIVLIHGLAGSSRWWRRNVPALSRHFDVHVIDLIGFGGSSRGGRFVLHEAGRLITRWMDAMGLERAHVVGHSMGGFIAADLAADFPERVDQLVLVSAAAMPGGQAAMPKLDELVRGLPYLPFSFLDLLIPDLCRAGVKNVLQAARELTKINLREKLATIRSPSMVIWGEHDPMVPLKVGKQIAALLPSKELVVIQRAGHNPMWERPAIFNRLLLEFFRAPQPTYPQVLPLPAGRVVPPPRVLRRAA